MLSIPFLIGAGVLATLALGVTMALRAEANVNQVALASSAKPVTVVEARSASFRGSRSYVGTIQPWVEAKIGPQMISAYVDTVLVRPGALVKKGEVIATLDCRNANATSRSVAMQARAMRRARKPFPTRPRAGRSSAQLRQCRRFSGCAVGRAPAQSTALACPPRLVPPAARSWRGD